MSIKIKVTGDYYGLMTGTIVTAEYIDNVGDARLIVDDQEQFDFYWVFNGDFVVVDEEVESMLTKSFRVTVTVTGAEELVDVLEVLRDYNGLDGVVVVTEKGDN